MPDPFFTQTTCDRCPNDLKIRTCSWFTDEAICMDCAGKEDEIKDVIQSLDLKTLDFEGCGYIPTLFVCPQCGTCQMDKSTATVNCKKCDFPCSIYVEVEKENEK